MARVNTLWLCPTIQGVRKMWSSRLSSQTHHEIPERKVLSHFFLRRIVAEISNDEWRGQCAGDDNKWACSAERCGLVGAWILNSSRLRNRRKKWLRTFLSEMTRTKRADTLRARLKRHGLSEEWRPDSRYHFLRYLPPIAIQSRPWGCFMVIQRAGFSSPSVLVNNRSHIIVTGHGSRLNPSKLFCWRQKQKQSLVFFS